MALKFMNIKKIVVPLLTLAILMSQLTGCTFMDSKDLLELMESGQSISIEAAAPYYTIANEVGTNQHVVNWSRLDTLKTHNTEIRIPMDKLLGCRAATLNGVNTKVGCLFVDSKGSANGNTTFQEGMRNRKFVETYYTSDTKTALKQLAAKVYTDVTGDDQNSLTAAFNAYYDLLPDNTDPNAFNGDQSLSREEFYTLLFKATTPVGELNKNDEFIAKMGGENEYTPYVAQIADKGFLSAANKSLEQGNITTSISRAEAIYIVVNTLFKDELSELTGKEKCIYTDVKNAGDLALKLGFKEKNKETKEIEAKERWQSYTLAYMFNHPEKGLQQELYNALIVAGKAGLLEGTESRWDEAISKSESIRLLQTSFFKLNELHGYLSLAEFGDMILDPAEIQDVPDIDEGITIPVDNPVYVIDPITGELIVAPGNDDPASGTDTPTSSIPELEIGDSLEDELDKILEGGTDEGSNKPSIPAPGQKPKPGGMGDWDSITPVPDDEKGSDDHTNTGETNGITGNPFA